MMILLSWNKKLLIGSSLDKLNSEDNGLRHFVLVSNNESNICRDVTVERIKKAKIKFVLLD